ncbi:inactive rhomboid protein 1 [Galendromus occidentalis]|uniref:Inactive rhomboid protein 1 n=1 Tax=Galendromus occidentalis TaxID=34638 RepID=A0AAJ6QWY1_9ACAR|nr:inactive rhomboid protein 1 [Galendromus occidentalis]
MVQEGREDPVTPVQGSSGTHPEPTTQISRILERGVSRIKEEAQDFLLYSGESQKKLEKRRQVVFARRFALKTDTDAQERPEELTKPPFLKLTADGFQTLKKKTQNVLRKDSERVEAQALESTRQSLLRRSQSHEIPMGVVSAPPELSPEAITFLAIKHLGPRSEDEFGSSSHTDLPSTDVHPAGKKIIFMRGVAPDNIRKQRRQFSLSNGLKKAFQLNYVTPIEYRPIFTYYVTVTQLLILLFSLWIYGFAPWGLKTERRQELVMVTSLTLENVDYEERQNIWFGNREADLIHLGARFTPCMRDDPGIRAEIVRDIKRERDTACCVRHDRSGCVQTQKDQCSENLSTWHKIMHPGVMVGSVCGQDPRYCNEPPSIEPYRWSEDFTKWPKCRKQHVPSTVRNGDLADENAHMACQVVGRPCCIGTYGQCEITTREYCEFVQGTFHDDAALCSQVSCLSDVCGMFPFVRSPESPDQIYRLLTSLFLHAGLLHFALTAIVQMWLMRDLERIYGPHRIGAIYMMSGIGGNLASAIFVPYRADVGPSAALFGIMAIFIAELVKLWDRLLDRKRATLHAVLPILIGIVCGLTPWTDNFGHLFGLIIGFVLAMVPHNSEKQNADLDESQMIEYRRKARRRWCLCAASLVIVFVGLLVWFTILPDIQCTFCHYFTCLPQIFGEACETHSVNYKPRIKIHF